MKKCALAILLICCSYSGYSQAYIPMPSDSGARWRYRIYDIDYVTHILDFEIFLNGADTMALGNVYHKIISRTTEYVVPDGFNPPIVSLSASVGDLYFSAIRESGKKVYSLNSVGGAETLMYDFNAAVGDSIPAYVGKVAVTATDSVLLSGVYHKRYHTTDTGYYIIEGIGSSRGLQPQLNDGGGDIAFYCFTNDSVAWSPDTTVPCTYIYPFSYSQAVTMPVPVADISIYPVPASGILHIIVPTPGDIIQGAITNSIGQQVWAGPIGRQTNIAVNQWPPGIYCLRLYGAQGVMVRKIVVE